MKDKFIRVREICGSWGLYEPGNSTEQAQLLKALSEIGELADSILKNDRDQAKDDIGDILVCMINADYIANPDAIPKIEEINISDMPFTRIYSLSSLLVEISEGIKNGGWMKQRVLHSLTCIAMSFGLTLEECLDQAISVIEKRKGKIINGAFVKDAT